MKRTLPGVQGLDSEGPGCAPPREAEVDEFPPEVRGIRNWVRLGSGIRATAAELPLGALSVCARVGH